MQWPLFWGALYLLAMPLYALVFEFVLPEKSFYHETLRNEPEVKAQAQQILNLLWAEYEKTGPSNSGTCKHLAPLAQTVKNDSLQIENDDISFSAVFMLTSLDGIEYRFDQRIRFSLDTNFDIPFQGPLGKGRATYYKEVTLDNLDQYRVLGTSEFGVSRCLFPTLYDESLPGNVALLRIPAALNEQLHTFANSLAGFPRRDSSDFWRMLYLSASTITTAGLGDIIPLTTPARMAVTSESIVGVVLIGLFLDAIAKTDRHTHKIFAG